jgi:hypothetical protein
MMSVIAIFRQQGKCLSAQRVLECRAWTGGLLAVVSLGARLAILAGAFLPWIVVYLLAHQGLAMLRPWKDWLKRIAIVLFLGSACFYVTDHTHLSNVLSA